MGEYYLDYLDELEEGDADVELLVNWLADNDKTGALHEIVLAGVRYIHTVPGAYAREIKALEQANEELS